MGTFEKPDTEHILCECGSEILQLMADDEDKQIFLSFFSLGHLGSRTFGFGHRFRMIWRIITKGTPYGDDIILGYDEAQKVVDFLNKYIVEKK